MTGTVIMVASDAGYSVLDASSHTFWAGRKVGLMAWV